MENLESDAWALDRNVLPLLILIFLSRKFSRKNQITLTVKTKNIFKKKDSVKLPESQKFVHEYLDIFSNICGPKLPERIVQTEKRCNLRPQPASRVPIIFPTISFPPMLVDRPAASSLSSRKMAGRRVTADELAAEGNDVHPCSLRSTHWPTATSSTVYRGCSTRFSCIFSPFDFYTPSWTTASWNLLFTQKWPDFAEETFSRNFETFVNCKSLLFLIID